MDQDEHERPQPAERFAGSEHLFDLEASAAALRHESQPARDGHRQIALAHQDGLTVILFDLEAGGRIPSHAASGTVVIQAIAGRVEVQTVQGTHDIPGGSLLILDPDVRHEVVATEPSQMLLTVSLSARV